MRTYRQQDIQPFVLVTEQSFAECQGCQINLCFSRRVFQPSDIFFGTIRFIYPRNLRSARLRDSTMWLAPTNASAVNMIVIRRVNLHF